MMMTMCLILPTGEFESAPGGGPVTPAFTTGTGHTSAAATVVAVGCGDGDAAGVGFALGAALGAPGAPDGSGVCGETEEPGRAVGAEEGGAVEPGAGEAPLTGAPEDDGVPGIAPIGPGPVVVPAPQPASTTTKNPVCRERRRRSMGAIIALEARQTRLTRA